MIPNPKVLLVYPNVPLMHSPPISIALFTAICKQENVQVEMFETTSYTDQFDSRHADYSEKGMLRKSADANTWITVKPTKEAIPDFVKKVQEYEPDLILVSVTEDVFVTGVELVEAIRDKNIPNIFGGVFTTFAPDLVLEYDVIDQICHQEGEQVLRDAIACLRNGEPLHDIKGTTYRFADHAQKNPPQALVDINEVTPDFSLFEQRRFGRWQGGKWFDASMQVETYRGCPYSCTFCNSPGQRAFSKDVGTGNFMRRKSAETIQKEMNIFREKYGVDHVNFVDDSFLARPMKELEDFAKVWSEHKTPFWCNTRIENCTPEVLQMMKECGMYRITFGLESGNEEFRRDKLKRNVTNEKYFKHMEYINDSNIPYSYNVIVGFPFETRDLILDSARFVRDSSAGHDTFNVYIWQPYNGTEITDMAVEAGFIKRQIWTLEDKIATGSSKTDGFQGTLLNHPPEYIQNEELRELYDNFMLYSYFPDYMYEEIQRSDRREELLALRNKEFMGGDVQEGGKDKIARLKPYQDKRIKFFEKARAVGCINHDPSIEDHFGVVA